MLLYLCIIHGCVHAVRELTSRDRLFDSQTPKYLLLGPLWRKTATLDIEAYTDSHTCSQRSK